MSKQPRQPDGEWTPIEDAKGAAALFVFCMRVMATPSEVILRRRFGKHALGLPAALALFAIPMWSIFWPDKDPSHLVTFWGVYFVALIQQRLAGIAMYMRGERVHSRYNGDSRLQFLAGRWISPDGVKGGLEGFLVIVVGFLLMPLSQPLGSFLVVSGMSVIGVMTTIKSVEKARLEQMHDAWLEKQHQSEQFREMEQRFRS